MGVEGLGWDMARSTRLAIAGLTVSIASFAAPVVAAVVAAPETLQASGADTLVLRRAAALALKREGVPAELKQLLTTDGLAPHLAQDPSFAELLSLAASNKLLGTSGNVFTIGLTPFLAYTLARPKVLESNDSYNAAASTWLRRVSGNLSFGGKGEFALKDSTGRPLPAPVADDLRDIVNWEVRLRVYGSRDPREIGSARRLLRVDALRLRSRSLARQEICDTLLARARIEDPTGAEYLDAKKARAVINDPALTDLLLKVAATEADLAREIRRARSDMAGALTVTVSAGATNQRAAFGPQRWKAGVSAAKGIAVSKDVVWDATLSGIARRTRTSKGGTDTTTAEFALKLSRPILSNWLGFAKGLPISMEYAVKLTDPVPPGGYRTILSALTSIELPVSEAAKATVSLRWADRADVLSKSDHLVGHFGLSYDFSGLFKAEEGKTSK